LGDLAARAAEERPHDLRQWAEIERTLAGRPRLPQRRWLVVVFPALAGVALWVAAGRPLGYRPQDCALTSDSGLSAPDNRECTLASDDGTRITLGNATRGQLRALGRIGAELVLQSGHADLSVVHRPGVRWEVLAGHFKVRVTGTRFAVDWAPEQGHLSLGVSQGEVSVSGGSLRDRRVRAGETVEVDSAAGGTDLSNLGADLRPTPAPVPAAPAEIGKKTAANTIASPGPAASNERKRGAPGGKPVVRSPALVVRPSPPAPTAAFPTEPPIAALEPAAKAWPASDAEDDAPAPGKGRLTVGANGKLADGAGGPVLAIGGVGTTFSAGSLSDHLYLDHDMLCTRGKIAELTCADEKIPTTRCNWATNWGVEIQWQPRTDGKAWGSRADSSLAIEYRGKTSHYRLVAHRQGDPLERVYCIENYRSGQAVAPSDFKLDCWNPGGASLSDFTRIDSFSLQVASRETSRRFNFCLSAVSLF
jgi:hypothetical protein